MTFGLIEAISVLGLLISAILAPALKYYVSSNNEKFNAIELQLQRLKSEREASDFECNKIHTQKIKEVETEMHKMVTNYKDRFEEIKDIIGSLRDLIGRQNLELRESNHSLRDNMSGILGEVKVTLATLTSKIDQLEAYHAKRS